MGLFKTVKRYKNRLAKRFSKEIKRQQFNFYCDWAIIATLKAFARKFEVPVYVLAEHCLQLGILEIIDLYNDEALKDQLCRHLVRDHLLTPVTKPQSEPISRRLIRLRNVMNLLSLLEIKNTPEEQAEIILGLFKKVKPTEENEE
jgi:hypothetical protein